MFRRLGQQNYRAESPSVDLNGSVSLSVHSDLSPLDLDSSSTRISSELEDMSMTSNSEKNSESIREHRIVEKPEIAMIVANICRKTKIRPYLINLDIDMLSAEAVLRYNIDRSNINETRIDWLLTYTKYQ
ncbi:hypothetical protein OSTOST_20452, partial [Ostertagia ostertagi]